MNKQALSRSSTFRRTLSSQSVDETLIQEKLDQKQLTSNSSRVTVKTLPGQERLPSADKKSEVNEQQTSLEQQAQKKSKKERRSVCVQTSVIKTQREDDQLSNRDVQSLRLQIEKVQNLGVRIPITCGCTPELNFTSVNYTQYCCPYSRTSRRRYDSS
eukprot:TRINITY_DN10687_c0_g1_i3.p2 TRINITY_DN10687_c0_g1~~TRINITY_DN10687_c0_g1_i3.p2  ORF type:complete len:158 (-),score=6.48 TRINITY_DN10687_c0_g1_i3:1-474(-)